jgi:hypothetical protein
VFCPGGCGVPTDAGTFVPGLSPAHLRASDDIRPHVQTSQCSHFVTIIVNLSQSLSMKKLKCLIQE